MDLVDMPMHKGSHERYIKEVVKSNGSKALDVMEKAKVSLETATVAVYRTQTLFTGCLSSRNNRICSPSGKRAKGGLEIGRPVGIREIGSGIA
jgi:hypothetical protein